MFPSMVSLDARDTTVIIFLFAQMAANDERLHSNKYITLPLSSCYCTSDFFSRFSRSRFCFFHFQAAYFPSPDKAFFTRGCLFIFSSFCSGISKVTFSLTIMTVA